MTTASDYYEVLQVSPNADVEVIQAAYRRLAMKWHPDRNPGDPFAVSQMKLLNEAYGVLSDSAKRRDYDLGRNRSGMSGGTDKDTPKAKPSAPPEPEPAAPPKPRASSPASDDGWSRAIPDAPAIFIAGGVLFLIGHYDILSGKSPAGPLAFLLTCFIWAVLFGTPGYLCLHARKRIAASVFATLFLLAAGFDVAVGIYNRYEMDKLPREPRPEVPKPATDQSEAHKDPFLAAMDPAKYYPPWFIEQGMTAGWEWESVAARIREVRGDPEPHKQKYQEFYKLYQLEVAHRKQATRGETNLEYLIRRAIPVGSAISNSRRIDRYKTAIERFNAGKAIQDDIDVIARFEWQQENDGQTAKRESGAVK